MENIKVQMDHNKPKSTKILRKGRVKLFLTYDDIDNPNLVGNKFFYLSQLSRLQGNFFVPKAICISTNMFQEILGHERIDWLKHFFEDLRATVGCYLVDSIADLNSLIQNLTLDQSFRNNLEYKLKEVFGERYLLKSYAVRSSSVSEDSVNNSYAGVYHSELNVKGIGQICSSILLIMSQYYSYSSIASRIRVNNYEYMPDLGIIIQQMVEPLYAGVAFTFKEKECMLEYVEGLGDKLVSGNIEPYRYSTETDYNASNYATDDQKLDDIISVILELKKVIGFQVDVEWAMNHRKDLYILQMRPVTKELAETNNDPKYLVASLYLEQLPLDLNLGECASVYASYVKKRSSIYQLAEQLGCKTGKGYVLNFNGKGLLTFANKFNDLLNSSQSDKYVLDLNDNIRQVILTKDDIFTYLVDTYTLTLNSLEQHTVILREFIQGDFGFISKYYKENELFIEYSYDGLLAINRGIADCYQVYFTEEGNVEIQTDQEVSTTLAENFNFIKKLTEEMNNKHHGCQLEWVMYQGTPYFVDYSNESSLITFEKNGDGLAIVKGSAHGPALNLIQEKETLFRLSVGPAVSINKSDDLAYHTELKKIFGVLEAFETKPIIVVDKPYAVLSIFFDKVAGFIFKEGSLLCHLSVLLRENEIPSLISPIIDEIKTNDELLISDQQLLILKVTEERGATS
ncbi:hypothetical protein HUB98_19390 [Paenibacillus barcinonensis]|uniref:Pyruvate phosphate dikinase AMP/ATP-binding domain-containing protein n=1 Tax=Paenibacillus barcinonensis TaxID=198119 RepID=A0ABX6Q7P8_PAEBA|nr:PEP/pyruvate-binding domain-containing protein [Paenibacillus barcinonensis]QKS58195.1 hypothetical protein HUB98_19390 [Paenibacillus barcinonensis]